MWGSQDVDTPLERLLARSQARAPACSPPPSAPTQTPRPARSHLGTRISHRISHRQPTPRRLLAPLATTQNRLRLRAGPGRPASPGGPAAALLPGLGCGRGGDVGLDAAGPRRPWLRQPGLPLRMKDRVARRRGLAGEVRGFRACSAQWGWVLSRGASGRRWIAPGPHPAPGGPPARGSWSRRRRTCGGDAKGLARLKRTSKSLGRGPGRRAGTRNSRVLAWQPGRLVSRNEADTTRAARSRHAAHRPTARSRSRRPSG
jgi:hypothetical protein